MTIHSRSETVRFNAPFTLSGLDRSYPAGEYTVRMEDEQLDLSFSAYRRVSTSIMLVTGAMTLAWPVSPGDLEAALAHDAASIPPGA